MSRILTIAQSEFLTLVKTKAFLFGIILMPVLMVGFFFFMSFAQRHVDVETRPFAVIDHTGVLYDAVQSAATSRNAENVNNGVRTGPEFVASRIDLAGQSAEEVKVDLSTRVRDKSLFAFVEIPAGVLTATVGEVPPIRYYSESTSYEPLPN